MTENKRFVETVSTGIVTDNKTGIEYSCEMRVDDDFLNLVNTIAEENELLKNKLDRIENILPHFLSCAEISEFRSETVKEDIALMKCWNKRHQK